MAHIQLTEEEAAFVRERIRQYQAVLPAAQQSLAEPRRYEALPLYLGWTETLAIRPNSELLRWISEDGSGASDFDEHTWRNIAIVCATRQAA